MNDESTPKGALETPAVAAGFISKSTITGLCHGAIAHQIAPNELPAPLADLWRDGFVEGASRARRAVQDEISRLEQAVNHWYVSANYSPAEIAEMRRKASYEQGDIDWSTGVVA